MQTVDNRQAAWRKKYGIDIALPNAYYRDALYFGANSVSMPKDRSATLAAHSGRDGEELLRLRDKAALDFDRLRREVVGATIQAPLHLMPVEVGSINPMAPLIAPTAASASGIAPTLHLCRRSRQVRRGRGRLLDIALQCGRVRETAWFILETEVVGPWFLGARFSAIDMFIAAMTQWRPQRAWFVAHSPRLTAIATSTDVLPELTSVWMRNFPATPSD